MPFCPVVVARYSKLCNLIARNVTAKGESYVRDKGMAGKNEE
jgi:hypothetical protein